MTISVGIFIIGKESIGQTKVNSYCALYMPAFWWHIKTAFHDGNMMGTTAFGGGSVTIWGAFLLIVG
jgi:hypothetical protein